jgi:hypothetical protein
MDKLMIHENSSPGEWCEWWRVLLRKIQLAVATVAVVPSTRACVIGKLRVVPILNNYQLFHGQDQLVIIVHGAPHPPGFLRVAMLTTLRINSSSIARAASPIHVHGHLPCGPSELLM